MKTAAIIGCNWGITYIPVLQKYGLEITGLVDSHAGKARQKANEFGVPLGTDKLTEIGQPDLVIIATPARTHAEIASGLSVDCKILMEKPAVGWQGDPTALLQIPGPIWVNYAFSQLRTAQHIGERFSDSPAKIRLSTQVNLPLRFSIHQWFFEVCSHPLSWLLHLTGRHHKNRVIAKDNGLEVALWCGPHQVSVDLRVGGQPGIYHQLNIRQEDRHLEISGFYEPNRPWRYLPVILNGQPISAGEYSAQDCWLEANARAIWRILECFEDPQKTDKWLMEGGYDLEKSLWLEATINNCHA